MCICFFGVGVLELEVVWNRILIRMELEEFFLYGEIKHNIKTYLYDAFNQLNWILLDEFN